MSRTYVAACGNCAFRHRSGYLATRLAAREHERTTTCTVQMSEVTGNGALTPLARAWWEGVTRPSDAPPLSLSSPWVQSRLAPVGAR